MGDGAPAGLAPVRGAGCLVWTFSWVLGVWFTVCCPGSCCCDRRRPAGTCLAGDGARRHLSCGRRRPAGSSSRVPVDVGLQLVVVRVLAAVGGPRIRSSGFPKGQGRGSSANRAVA